MYELHAIQQAVRDEDLPRIRYCLYSIMRVYAWGHNPPLADRLMGIVQVFIASHKYGHLALRAYVQVFKDTIKTNFIAHSNVSGMIAELHTILKVEGVPPIIEELRAMTSPMIVGKQLKGETFPEDLLPGTSSNPPRDPFIVLQNRVIKNYAHSHHISNDEAAWIWINSNLASQYRSFVYGEDPYALQDSQESDPPRPEK